MPPALHTTLMVAMRWIHIASAIVLLGGFFFARFVLAPALSGESEPGPLAARVAAKFRPILITIVITIFGSGLYNYLTKENYPPHYHMWMGIKLLVVLDVLATTLLYAAASPADIAKRHRQAMHIVIAGAAIVLISGWLRYLSLSPVVKLP